MTNIVEDYIKPRSNYFLAKIDDKNYKGFDVKFCDDLVIKKPKIGCDYNLAVQKDICTILDTHNIPHSHIYYYHNSYCAGNYNFYVAAKVDGEMVAEKGWNEELIKDFVAQLKKIHQIKVKNHGFVWIAHSGELLGSQHHWHDHIFSKAYIHHLSDISMDIKRRMTPIMNSYVANNFSPVLLHNDLNNKNILVKDNKVAAFIDWEDAIGGDPIFELANWCTFNEAKWHDLFLDSYYGSAVRPENFSSTFWFYYLRISIAKLYHLHRKGFTDLTRARERITTALEKLEEFI
jgi:thiamine kinase-like enzyme